MSSHFSANQYEGPFAAERLQNYEVPAPPKKEHPSMRIGSTKIISNDRGHILIESKRSTASPWGTFVGTWQAERKPIELMTRTKLQNNLSNIKYIPNPSKMKTKDDGNTGNNKEPAATIQDQLTLEHESCPVQMEEVNDTSSLPPSQPESRMDGLSGAQSPLDSSQPTNELEVPKNTTSP